MARRGPSKYQRAAMRPVRDVSRLAHGGAKRQVRGGSEWFVREIPSAQAEKRYLCPDCLTEIPIGQAHVVAWSAEHMFGDEAALRERRHYHSHCWRLG